MVNMEVLEKFMRCWTSICVKLSLRTAQPFLLTRKVVNWGAFRASFVPGGHKKMAKSMGQ